MKKIIIAFLPWLFTFGHKAFGQEEQIAREKAADGKTKETQEIIIRKKGDKDANITIQINGDQVLINGKPISEFKDDEISVNKKKVIIRNGDHMIFAEGLNDFDEDDFHWVEAPGNKAFLGVSTEKSDGGAKITAITKESAAEKAGLQKDDIITKLNDKKVDGPQSLFDAISPLKPNDEVKVYIKRDGKEKTIKATLQQRKEGPHSFSMSSSDGTVKTLTIPRMRKMEMDGMHPENFEDMEFNYQYPRQQKIGLKIQDTEEGKGVKVLDVDENSAAATAGLKKNDIITEINGKKITNTDEAREELQSNKDKSTYSLKASRNGTSMSFDIKIPKKLKTANL